MIKAKISNPQMKANLDPYARMRRHIEATELDHADGSVTERKLSQEVREKLNCGGGSADLPDWVTDTPPIYTAVIVENGDTCKIVSGSYEEIADAYNNGTTVLLNVTVQAPNGSNSLYRCCHLLMFEAGTIVRFGIDDGEVSYSYLWNSNNTINKSIIELAMKSDLNDKADKSTTLSGYGITDAYTREEVDEINQNNVNETILYEDVVNTPEWTKQPTYSGVLDSAFNNKDYYYVTLNDTNGNPLPDGQFMLKDFYTENAIVYSTVFSLADLNTGTDILVENYPVEFTYVGINFGMRDAGVWEFAHSLDEWKLNGNNGQLRLVCAGEFVQRMSSAYYIPCCLVDKKVSHYHSTHSTSYQSESTSQVIPYAQNSSVSGYKVNKFFEDFVIERVSDGRYHTRRNMTMRCQSYGSSAYTVSANSVVGHGEILNGDTKVKKIGIQVAVNTNRGFIRNGSVIRVTEVKQDVRFD